MTAVHQSATAGRPRTSGASSGRRDVKQQHNFLEKDKDEERSRPLKSKQAWSDASSDISPTAEQTFDEFTKVGDTSLSL